jgi:zinc/manganese transport system substrate-binding protein
MLRRSLIGTLVALAVLASACSASNDTADRLSVVTTTTILGDVVSNITVDDADVDVLMPIGASPHEFVPSARQVAAIYEADLVVANGLGLEEGLHDVLETARADGVNVLEIAPRLDPLPFREGDQLDPHVWMDPVRMRAAAVAIADALFVIDGNVAWNARAEAYAAELEATHHQIEAMLEEVPPDERILVTNHDSLGYFADRYRFSVIGTVIPGGGSLGDPSSAQLTELVDVIEREQVPAIFVETSEPRTLAVAVAAEVGTAVSVVELYTGSLAERGQAGDTLVGMLLVDAERIASALGS